MQELLQAEPSCHPKCSQQLDDLAGACLYLVSCRAEVCMIRSVISLSFPYSILKLCTGFQPNTAGGAAERARSLSVLLGRPPDK